MNVPDPVSIAVTGGLVLSGANQAAKQIQDLTVAAFGHPGESVGTMLGTFIHRRIENAQSIFDRAHFILLDIGVPHKGIDMNFLQPAIEASSLQEDDCLRTTWANMLANAADSRQPKLEPLFARILGDFTSREVKFLDKLSRHNMIVRGLDEDGLQNAYFDAGLASKPTPDPVAHFPKQEILAEVDKTDFSITMDIVTRARVLMQERSQLTVFSPLGKAFMKACQPPPPKL